MALFGQQLTLTPRLKGSLQNAAPGDPNAAPRGGVNLDNALKLIPGDAVSLFITGAGLSKVVEMTNWAAICFWVCFAVCALVRVVASRPAAATGLSLKGVNWSLTVATLAAFFIWAHAVSATGPVIAGFHGPAAGFFAMVLGVVAPLLVRVN